MRLTPIAAAIVLATTLTGAPAQAAPAQPRIADQAAPDQPRIADQPPMGWSSWSSLRGNISAAIIEAQADAMHAHLQQFGYRYVNVDAGWSDHLDGYGRDAWNATKFPDGIAPVADHVHQLGLRFGIYLVPGVPKAAVEANLPIFGTPYHAQDIADTTTPGNTLGDAWRIDFTKPGAVEYVQSYADLLASWGVDYIKMDFVGPGGGRNPADNTADVAQWRAALDRTGRDIHLELSNSLSFTQAAWWARYTNGWRIEGDVECYSKCPGLLTSWSPRVVQRWTDAPKWVPFAGPGHWNDMDSLELGNGAREGLTPAERVSVLTLWALQASPLLLGTDLTRLDPYDLSLITNREVIAVDRAGRPGHPISQATKQQVWFRADDADTYTVALFNLADTAATVSVSWTDLGIVGRRVPAVRDLWTHTDLGLVRQGYRVVLAPHAAQLLRVHIVF